MNKFILFSILISSTLFGQENTYLKGKITNPSTNKCYLYSVLTDVETGEYQQIYLDSTELNKEGEFSMVFNLEKSTIAYFYDGKESTTLNLHKGDELYLTLNTKFFDETIVFSGKGSERNNALKNLALLQSTIGDKFDSYDISKDTTEVFIYFDQSYTDLKNLILDYKKTYPDFEIPPILLDENLAWDLNTRKKMFAMNHAMLALIGTDAIDFNGEDSKGKTIKFSSFKGKTTVIDFWATWCGPCRAEMPSLKVLEEKYGKNVNFVSVGVYNDDKNKESWFKMAKDFGFEKVMYISREDILQIAAYSVEFIPRYIVVDENLKIVDAMAPVPSSGELEKYFRGKE
ncbi:MAG: hypothetical protein RI883_1718 [Bacteroidota bacterium]|jgi:thiol-disulfide isomerase/thioredoxin